MRFCDVVTSEKGGTGKTTLAISLADKASHKYRLHTLLVDADVDQSDAFRVSTGNADPDNLAIVRSHWDFDVVWVETAGDLLALPCARYDVLVIDGRPSSLISGALSELARRVFIPYGTEQDWFAAERFAAELPGDGKEVVFVFNNSRNLPPCEIVGTPGLRVPFCRWFLRGNVVRARRVFERANMGAW